MVDREVLVESTAAVSGVLVFVVFLLVVGSGSSGEGLSESGARLVVAGIALFVVVMSALGWWLSTKF
jgi:hypothetical protein